ncbi:MAG: GMC family oxidoreductase, partial [Nitrospinota bacterium]|nr:GMC family oxidoreductase [Nitrospinota bacterium]
GIDTLILEDPEDAAAIVSAMRFVERLAGTGPMREFYGPLLQPGPDEDWAAHARSNFDSFRHGVGTCAMGPASSETAVVDPRLRVHGMENLYIADASVIPVLPHAHTNHACMMIAERFCELLTETG